MIRRDKSGRIVEQSTAGCSMVQESRSSGFTPAAPTCMQIFGGFYPGGGGAIGPAMTFGYLAAKDMIDEQGKDGA